MKASELRLGNYVYDTLGKVNKIDLEAITYIVKEPRNQVKPIPLTEEWLLKFELEQHHVDYYCDTFMLRQIDEHEWIVKYYPEELGSAKLIKKGIILKYVHQLQNLCFGLTGGELVVKE
jgi:hypothetical protein